LTAIGQAACAFDRLPCAGGARQAARQHRHRLFEGALAHLQPGGAQPIHRLAHLAIEHRLHRTQQRQLLHPAACEGVHRQHLHAGAQALQMAPPAFDVVGLLLRGAGRTELVQQHEHRFVEPSEQRHLGLDIGSGLRRFGRVDEVQHDVRVLAHVAQRLLAVPERAVEPTVPNLGEEPAECVALQAQPSHQPHAVAQARRIPHPQFVALLTAHQKVVLAELGDVRRVAHLADVTLQ
jgi:hypothetical protein